ncbi:MAG: hypothetical protein KF791_07685 [Verrucomicrobiae bacterium]|nr:hypothetical protein [Verrucomicrobiae bacterium]
MEPSSRILGAVFGLFLAGAALAQTGPFDPGQWPATINPDFPVHYIVTDDGLEPPGPFWDNSALSILSGGDQIAEDITIGGRTGKKVLGNYLNVADFLFDTWADYDTIDILVQAYGDAGLFDAAGNPRNFNFLTGTLPELAAPVGGQVPLEAGNKRWNWILFRIPNGVRASDGTRLVGSIPANAQGGFQNGGVNGGTIRLENVPGLTVRVVAFGVPGAFGEPEAINIFLPPEACDPEPETNLAGMDLAAGTASHLEVIDRGDQTVEFQDDVGPVGDRRRAVRPAGQFLNFGITDNYLGLPCNDPKTVKVCVDFYDDPAFAGMDVRFGPEAYATDDQGGIGFFPAGNRQVLEGTGTWVRRSWTVPAVNLFGVNAAPTHTAGPRFVSENGQVFVSRFEIAVLRTGTHPLAGQDPLADCFEDLSICTDQYGNFAELDLHLEIQNGLAAGSSGGDQEMIIEEAGPAGDRRLAVRPARDDGTPGFVHGYLNFAIIDEPFGPTSQPPADLSICITYYDDPELAGTRIKPEVYRTEANGVETFGFTPDSFFVELEGTGEWRTAYWEIQRVKFSGVNQGPQAAARFTTANAGDVQAKIAVTRVRYGVIRPCGPFAGINPLEECRPPVEVALTIERVEGNLVLTWPAAASGFAIQATPRLDDPDWGTVEASVEVVDGQNVATLPLGDEERYFRLLQ